MPEYIKTKGGYFYKVYTNGKKKRISLDEYKKRNIIRGGSSSANTVGEGGGGGGGGGGGNKNPYEIIKSAIDLLIFYIKPPTSKVQEVNHRFAQIEKGISKYNTNTINNSSYTFDVVCYLYKQILLNKSITRCLEIISNKLKGSELSNKGFIAKRLLDICKTIYVMIRTIQKYRGYLLSKIEYKVANLSNEAPYYRRELKAFYNKLARITNGPGSMVQCVKGSPKNIMKINCHCGLCNLIDIIN